MGCQFPPTKLVTTLATQCRPESGSRRLRLRSLNRPHQRWRCWTGSHHCSLERSEGAQSPRRNWRRSVLPYTPLARYCREWWQGLPRRPSDRRWSEHWAQALRHILGPLRQLVPPGRTPKLLAPPQPRDAPSQLPGRRSVRRSSRRVLRSNVTPLRAPARSGRPWTQCCVASWDWETDRRWSWYDGRARVTTRSSSAPGHGAEWPETPGGQCPGSAPGPGPPTARSGPGAQWC